jgi:hypothetical protein
MYWRDSLSSMSNSMQEICCRCSDNANRHDPMPDRIIPFSVMRTGSGNQSDYVQANSDFDNEIDAITQQLRVGHSQHGTLDAFVRFANLMLVSAPVLAD